MPKEKKTAKSKTQAAKAAAARVFSVFFRIISTLMLILFTTGCILGLYTIILHFQGKVNIWDMFRECFEILRSYI